MQIKTRPFDPADYLGSDEAMAVYMSEALDSNDPGFIADPLGVIARARGMTQVARDAGLSRESLYRTLSSEGNPELSTLLRVPGVLGLRLSVRPVVGGEKRGMADAGHCLPGTCADVDRARDEGDRRRHDPVATNCPVRRVDFRSSDTREEKFPGGYRRKHEALARLVKGKFWDA